MAILNAPMLQLPLPIGSQPSGTSVGPRVSLCSVFEGATGMRHVPNRSLTRARDAIRGRSRDSHDRRGAMVRLVGMVSRLLLTVCRGDRELPQAFVGG